MIDYKLDIHLFRY